MFGINSVKKRKQENFESEPNYAEPYAGTLPRKNRPSAPPNHILLFTILNDQYPITTDVIHAITSSFGNVVRIVIFRKTVVQAMVEFDSIQSAQSAMDSLNGADIYTGCCTLQIEFAKQKKLNVKQNTSDTWDYTVVQPGVRQATNARKTLLPSPTETDFDDESFYLASERHPQNRPLLKATFPAERHPQSRPLINAGLGQPGSRNVRNNFTSGIKNYGEVDANSYADYDIRPISFGNNVNSRSELEWKGKGRSSSYSPVLMIYELDENRDNCKRVFNLLCLYGNVKRVRFLKSKAGCAMVEMGDPDSVDRCRQFLNSVALISKKTLSVGSSKQEFVSEPDKPHTLNDGTSAYQDFTSSKNNRFLNAENASKNRIQAPTKLLHFYNSPPNITEEELRDIINTNLVAVGITVKSVKLFPKKQEAKSGAGLLEFESVEMAVEAIMACNYVPIETQDSKFPFLLKLCFSSQAVDRSNMRNENGNYSTNLKIRDWTTELQ